MPNGLSEAPWPQRRGATGPPGEASDGRSVGEAPSAGGGAPGSRCPWNRHPPSLRQGEPPRGRSGRGGTASAHATDRRAGRRIGVSDPYTVLTTLADPHGVTRSAPISIHYTRTRWW